MATTISTIVALALVAALIVRFMVRNSLGSQVRRHLWVTLGFGIVGVVAALALELFGGSLFGNDLSVFGGFGTLPLLSFIAFLCVGLIEEFAKFFPFSRYLQDKPYFTSVTDAFVYFVIIGMVFTIIEDISYAISLGGSVIFGRVAVAFFFHAGLSGLVGYYYARAHFLHESSRSVWIAFLVAATIHGVYDYSLSSSFGLFLIAWGLTIGVNAMLFWLYYRANVLDYQLRTGQIRPQQPVYQQPVHQPVMMPTQQYAAPQQWPAPQPVSPPAQPAWPAQQSIPPYQPTPSYVPQPTAQPSFAPQASVPAAPVTAPVPQYPQNPVAPSATPSYPSTPTPPPYQQ